MTLNFFEQTVPFSCGFDVWSTDFSQCRGVLEKLDELNLLSYLAYRPSQHGHFFGLRSEVTELLATQSETMNLCGAFSLDTISSTADLEREIVLALLAAPRPLHFSCTAEFISAVAIRRNIVLAARCTQLAFGTAEADRPPSHWTYDEERGFTLLPKQPLIEALKLATQPDAGDGQLYSFSCYRASEYVMLLGIAQELERVNPQLLAALQQQWETRSIKSRAFHDVFLIEYGSLDSPLPLGYYVPGDRVWFRNPDLHSSDASGYEGSWVIYLGNGMFSNFWRRDRPYSLVEKCVEIYHWRHGTYTDRAGDLRMDEVIVEARIAETKADEFSLNAIVQRMQRLRDAPGRFANGGCMDFSREFARNVCVNSADILLPG